MVWVSDGWNFVLRRDDSGLFTFGPPGLDHWSQVKSLICRFRGHRWEPIKTTTGLMLVPDHGLGAFFEPCDGTEATHLGCQCCRKVINA